LVVTIAVVASFACVDHPIAAIGWPAIGTAGVGLYVAVVSAVIADFNACELAISADRGHETHDAKMVEGPATEM